MQIERPPGPAYAERLARVGGGDKGGARRTGLRGLSRLPQVSDG